VIVRDVICWISLTERKHANGKKGQVYKAPIFVAHFPGQPYFFISRSQKNEDILDVSFITLKPSLLDKILGVHSSEYSYPCLLSFYIMY
jgi:hypothetical protein